MSVFCFFYR